MLDPFLLLTPVLLIPIVALLRFTGCSSFSSMDIPELTIDPATAQVGPGEQARFVARLGGSLIMDAIWTNAAGGVYTAPAKFAGGVVPADVTVTATSGSSSGNATVTHKHAALSFAPSVATLKPGQQQVFTATVTGAADKTVTWVGADATGKFTAPPYVQGAIPVVVSATSVADPSVKGQATVTLIGNSAILAAQDLTTKGKWKILYGTKGWLMAHQPTNFSNLPPYIDAVSPTPPAFTYSQPAGDLRPLDLPTGMGTIACVWHDPSIFKISINCKDFAVHQIAVYCVDYQNAGIQQAVEIWDGDTNAVLQSALVKNLGTTPAYLVWKITGHISLVVKNGAAPDAAIAAIFFD